MWSQTQWKILEIFQQLHQQFSVTYYLKCEIYILNRYMEVKNKTKMPTTHIKGV